MKKLWKKVMAAAAVCLAAGMLLCAAGCSGGRSGTQYKYEGSSFTDTYNLYDDGTYERIYENDVYSGMTLESGSYEESSSSAAFTVENISDEWPSGVSKYYLFSNTYHGTLNDSSLYISGRTYKKHGSVYSSN